MFTARGPETALDWATRIRVSQGAARGLVHLHQNENIVHGNLTASNILLDTRGSLITASISDFGLSRLMTPAANANVVATAGSLGYRAPELTKLKKATTKSDVYSFGIVLLELLTGNFLFRSVVSLGILGSGSLNSTILFFSSDLIGSILSLI